VLGRRPDNRATLRRVYADHVGAVYAFFAASLERHTAEDLTASTFERVVRSWRSYDPSRAGERTWIMAIARNLLVDHSRRQKHRAALSTDADASLLEVLPPDEDPLDRALSSEELRSWLMRLGERERQIVALRFMADLTAADIAPIVGLSQANVHQILSRSLRALREAWETEAESQRQRSTRRSTVA
jgi:RNA polymerase sigma-70 factor, ECF subfamily